ncbi:class E sortase [Geodermatophilus obscurus]|uniref:Sortase family protein n=1 Tax=Geodermatophilus obscurus (strain ATCC 25078 / DSM 43160 / JCM 3152 / CCUG 61914 / KCC A-0152 / KCTC 9177 / NBRC 13315 / NRRL B-3577 / G-20) TaxID=526225 RepID=D2S8W0_GEOOG|nr:class E sortase [Geodermatophilus obscurus]ADB73603.1 sortase family protein [Geodermatophilus obscurus DSM 43160]
MSTAPADLLRTAARGVGQLLLTAGYVLLLFVVYELWVTDLLSNARQDELTAELREEWAAPAAVPAELQGGEAFAMLHIPRLGADYARAVVEGTGTEDLEQGPGHYRGTAMPGEQGNFAVAGHRVGRGSPFLEIDELRTGDPVVVETADSWFVYRVLGPADVVPGQQVVSPYDVSVIAPTPNGPPDGAPTGAYLTLTTCHPEYSARERLIVHAVLEGGPVSRAEAPEGPPALRGV